MSNVAANSIPSTSSMEETALLKEAICPHCWHRFEPDKILWRAVAEVLSDDPVLGRGAPLCFLPSRFDPAGLAIDALGHLCHVTVCPRCHQSVPRDLLFAEPTFVSVVGAPGSGKSYLLAAMTHILRRRLPENAGLVFTDTDAESNLVLSDNERVLFHNPDPSAFAFLRKTEVSGNEMYHSVAINEQRFLLPRPLMFALRPTAGHPGRSDDPGLQLVLYDNAGESFIPGADTAQSPVTRHVAHSRAVIYMFDPTKDAAFRSHLDGQDPQVAIIQDVQRQDVMLNEIALRIRRLLNLAPGQRHRAPLVLVVAKFDLWKHLLGLEIGPAPIYRNEQGKCGVLSEMQCDSVSLAVRELLKRVCPEIVACAEAGWECVRYFPASATGCSPTLMSDTGLLAVQPGTLQPIWVEAALAWLFSRWRPDLLPVWRQNSGASAVLPARVRQSGYLLLAELPDGRTLEAPLDYAGRVVRCPWLGGDIRLGEAYPGN